MKRLIVLYGIRVLMVIRDRHGASRRIFRSWMLRSAMVLGGVAAVWLLCWLLWPAGGLSTPEHVAFQATVQQPVAQPHPTGILSPAVVDFTSMIVPSLTIVIIVVVCMVLMFASGDIIIPIAISAFMFLLALNFGPTFLSLFMVP